MNTLSLSTLAFRKERVRKIIPKLFSLFHKPNTALHHKTPWELLVAVILSAQCTDKRVNIVTAKLFRKYKNLDDYVEANPIEFEKDIYSTGFYKNKTKNILAAAKLIKKRCQGAVPRTMSALVQIPGVGRKTANVVLGNAHGVVEGIAVDTHVIRLSQLLGLTDHKDAIKIERDLMLIVPKKHWFDFTNLLIAYGRKYCPARKHRCEECPLTKLLAALE